MEEYRSNDEGDLTDEELTGEGDLTEEELTGEDDMTDEELTLIMGVQIALVGVLFGMAIMGLLVYVTTPAFKFFIRYSFMNPTCCSRFMPNDCRNAVSFAGESAMAPKISERYERSYKNSARLKGHFSITRNTARAKTVLASSGKLSCKCSSISEPILYNTLLAPYSLVAIDSAMEGKKM